MSILRNGSLTKYKIYHNGNKLKKGYYNGTVEIWSAGNIVTYVVDTVDGLGKEYEEEVDYDASCLSPKTFKPYKPGWTFIGWRKDKTASGEKEESVVMGDDPIKLYAIYEQTITLSYNGNGATSGSIKDEQKQRYYNSSGQSTKAVFKLVNNTNGFTKTNYTFNGWDLGAAGKTVELEKNTTAYAQWIGTPYTWVSNYVGYGATLTIRGEFYEDIEEEHIYNDDFYSGVSNRFQIKGRRHDQDDYIMNFTTNAVQTRGLSKMKITFPNTDGSFYTEAGGYFKVMSSDNRELYSTTVYIGATTIDVDVSSAESVYISVYGRAGYWNTNCYCNVSTISFSN